MQCDRCGQAFEPTPDNPGTTFAGGYADENRVETIHLCDEHVAAFHALSMEEQHAFVEKVTHG